MIQQRIRALWGKPQIRDAGLAALLLVPTPWNSSQRSDEQLWSFTCSVEPPAVSQRHK